MKDTSRSNPQSNCVLIPDPSKILDLLYLEAHSLIDRLSRPALMRLLPELHKRIEHDSDKPAPGEASQRTARHWIPHTGLSPTARSQCRALIIDDDPDVVEAVSDILISLGHEHDFAGSLVEARRLLRTEEFTYILLDLEIPARSHRSVPRIQNTENLLEEIRQARDGVPVIIMTDFAPQTPDMAMQIMRLAVTLTRKGASDFINKPFPKAGRTLDRVIKKNLAGRQTRQVNKAAAVPSPRPKGKPQPFEGGELVFYPTRVELCEVKVCGDEDRGMIRRILEELNVKNSRGTYVALSGEELAKKVKRFTTQNSVAGCIRDFRKHVTQVLLEEANLSCGSRDVIQSGGRGYRLTGKISVRTANGPANGTDEPDGPHANDTDDLLSGRQRWILDELRKGMQLRIQQVTTRFNCSKTTAKRDLTKLRKRGLIVFEGAAKTGRYKLRK